MKDTLGYEVKDFERENELMVTKGFNILLELYNYLFEFDSVDELSEKDFDKIMEELTDALNILDGYGG